MTVIQEHHTTNAALLPIRQQTSHQQSHVPGRPAIDARRAPRRLGAEQLGEVGVGGDAQPTKARYGCAAQQIGSQHTRAARPQRLPCEVP